MTEPIAEASFSLVCLGNDCLREVLNWCPRSELGRLYLCGNRDLIARITVGGAARRIHLDYDYETRALFWPNVAFLFPHLTHFAYMRGRVNGSVRFSFTIEHLKLLPSSLESIWLGGERAESCWFESPVRMYNIEAGTEITPELVREIKSEHLDFERYFPRLKKLVLRDTSSGCRGFDAGSVLVLPRTLTYLSMYWNTSLPSWSFKHMPTSMSVIRLARTSLKVNDCADLPPNVTKLMTQKLLISTEDDIRHLPQTLRSVALKFEQSISPQAFSLFPNSLTRLGIVPLTSTTIKYLPKTLRCLVADDNELWPISELAKLPSSLTHIYLRTHSSNEVFRHLPHNVEVIRFSANKPTFDHSLEEFPPKLRTIKVPFGSPVLSNADFKVFPFRIIAAPYLDN